MLTRRARLDLAYISPLNPVPSGLSDYSETLIPALAEWADLVLYSDCGTPANPEIARRFTVRPVPQLARHHTEHDLRLYQIGNSAQHGNAFAALRWLPGIVVLHEPFLHGGLLFTSSVLYRRQVYYDLGRPDRAAAERYESLTHSDDRVPLLALPLIGRIVDSSLGIIVHSQAARQVILTYEQNRPGPPRSLAETAIIPQIMPMLNPLDQRECRAELNLPQDVPVFGVAGTVHTSKQPHLVLRAFAQVARQIPQARLVFAGELPLDYGLAALIQELGLAASVVFLGRVEPLERLHRAMAACDVLINLRWPTIGETSATALRAMALGRPLIVNKIGWYAELPEAACSKIETTASADGLSAMMLSLSASPEARQRMGEHGRDYIRTECAPSVVARRYAEFLWSVYDRIACRLDARGRRD
jgi:glycosyltransferase involved in cell wall biosynthesis